MKKSKEEKIPSSYDIIGDIAILKFEEKTKSKEKKKTAEKLLEERKNIKTVLEKKNKIKGRLRALNTGFLAGVKKTETICIESGCRFKLDVEKCYFSPRLSGERLSVAGKLKKGKDILVMFSGVGPFSVIIDKISKARKIISIELGRECCKYAVENNKLNKIENIEVLQGDVKKIIPKLVKRKEKFDYVLMPRPNLKDSFLNEAFKVVKNKSEVIYYGFGKDVGDILKEIFLEAKKVKKKIKVLQVKKAGEIAPYKFRWRVWFKVEV